jgi:probable phosphoglycerate mutase
LVCRAETANDKLPVQYQVMLGQTLDCGLSMEGKQRVKDLAECFGRRRINHIYTSPAARTYEAAMAISYALDGIGLNMRTELSAIDYGDWTGKTRFDVLTEDSDRYAAFMEDPAKHGCPGGESFHDVQQRVMPFIMRKAAEHIDDSIAVVTHPDVVRVAIAQVAGLPLSRMRDLDQFPGRITVLRYFRGEMSLAAVNQEAISEEMLQPA